MERRTVAVTLEKIYEVAIRNYGMKLLAGEKGIYRLADWVHVVEEKDYIKFLKGRELIITTGISRPDEEELFLFAQKVYEANASGLVINIGKYIPKVPERVLDFCREHDFPVFTIPWEVHLVEFNRELCNLIYKSEREYDNLDTAVRKAIFQTEGSQEYQMTFSKEGITKETKVRLIQCYFSSADVKKEEKKVYDMTQFYYLFSQYCQQILSELGRKYVVFHASLYVTIVLFGAEEGDDTWVIERIRKFLVSKEKAAQSFFAVSDADTRIYNLAEKYRNLSKICHWMPRGERDVCYEERMGMWRLLLAIPDDTTLQKYEEQVLGELKRVDAETGSAYCRILEAYLNENGNIQEVAAQSFLHRNTITYHLKKIAEITGRDLGSAKDRMELYLAFQIQKILE